MNLLYIPFPEWLSPVIIPGLPFRWYGLMYLVAFGLSWWLTTVQLRDPRLGVSRTVTADEVSNLYFWMILGIIVGARVIAATVYDTSGRYLTRPWLIFWPFDDSGRFVGLQGMSYHGGLIGVVVAFVIYCRIRKIDILEMGDVVATSVPLGYTFGRLGNFINGELYGRITRAPWGVLFPNAERVPADHPVVATWARELGIDATGQAFINMPRHPSQLYEALLEGVVLFLVMWFLVRPRVRVRGVMVGTYLIGYGLARFIAEYFRAPDPGLDFVVQLGPSANPRWLLLSPWNLTTGQMFSAGMIAAGIAWLAMCIVIDRRRPRVQTWGAKR